MEVNSLNGYYPWWQVGSSLTRGHGNDSGCQWLGRRKAVALGASQEHQFGHRAMQDVGLTGPCLVQSSRAQFMGCQ